MIRSWLRGMAVRRRRGRRIRCVNGMNIEDLNAVHYVRLSATPC